MLRRIKHAVGLGKLKKSRRHLHHGLFASKGTSNHAMEDFAVSETRHIDGHHVGLFAVYDGHLGHQVAEYLQAHLLDNVLSQPSFWTDPTTAITEAYLRTDRLILERAGELGMGGSTAVTAIVIDGSSAYVANVGDSRAVLCRAGTATPVTNDHDPVSEKASIQKKGGLVTTLPGDVPRVNGQLAVGRAFGDKYLKEIIRADPSVYCVLIQITDEFLILASDGLWKVTENQVAVDLIRDVKNPKAAARQLVNYAIQNNSKDDISCVVVRFH